MSPLGIWQNRTKSPYPYLPYPQALLERNEAEMEELRKDISTSRDRDAFLVAYRHQVWAYGEGRYEHCGRRRIVCCTVTAFALLVSNPFVNHLPQQIEDWDANLSLDALCWPVDMAEAFEAAWDKVWA